jgi:Heavy-metal resistance
MIGCIIVGGLAALGIAGIARRHRWRGCGGDWTGGGGGCGGRRGHGEHWEGHGADDGFAADDGGYSAWLGHGRHWRHRGGFRQGPMFILEGVLRRLETTPSQSQALRSAAKEFKESARVLKDEARRTRADFATSLRRSSIDAEALGELFARHDTAIDSVRKAFVGMTVKVHDILDDTQRERLAQLIEHGPRAFRGPAAAAW